MIEPLAFRIRPTSLDEIVGQQHLFNQNGLLRKMIEQKVIYSMIFYGPPGSGKTTTAMLLAKLLNRPFRLFNAVTGNKKELDGIYLEAKLSEGLVLIMDEVHRLNKDKQDTLLPYLEDGLITLIGATTSNPLFAINPAIRSRAHLIEFKSLEDDAMEKLIINALKHPSGFKKSYTITKEALDIIIGNANGDSRYALNLLELATLNTEDVISDQVLKEVAPKLNVSFDKDGDHFYDTLSGFQKSIRGSDVDGALYYLAKLVSVGDLVSIERRLLVIAYEDIGLANSALCSRVLIALESAKRVGLPEARIILSEIVIELALSPKSKSANKAIDAAMDVISKTSYQTPSYLRLNPVSMEDVDRYDYDRKDLWHKIQYLPKELKDISFYEPENLHSQEKVLADNYQKLKLVKRTSNLRKLKEKNKEPK